MAQATDRSAGGSSVATFTQWIVHLFKKRIKLTILVVQCYVDAECG